MNKLFRMYRKIMLLIAMVVSLVLAIMIVVLRGINYEMYQDVVFLFLEIFFFATAYYCWIVAIEED